MKRQKGSILQRMMAMLLTAALVVGMTSNAVPNTVLAQEDAASSVSGGRQESAEGNTEEPAEGNTKPEEKAPAPVETTNPEGPKQETSAPEEEPKQETPVPEEEPKQETPKPDGETAEQGTVSGNDAQPEMTAAPQSVMLVAASAPQADYIAEDSASAEEHEHDGVTFGPWTETDNLPTGAGNYYLTENVTLSGYWDVPPGTTNLCLNGKTVSNAMVIRIGSSRALHLYDCQNTGNITGGEKSGVEVNDGTFHMYGGKISGNTGGGVAVDGGTFEMDGGEISGNTGGGVAVNGGTFQMHGGKISGNMGATAGGGVCVSGIFEMDGGEISGNTAADSGGGVFVNRGTFRMHGGKISGNMGDHSGGGVYVSSGTFEMNGGEISGNTAAHSGGGVYVSVAFAVGGGAVISGNTSNGTENNVYLSDELIELDSSNPLSEPAKIGVTTYSAPTEGNAVNITGHNKGDYSSYFTSDNPAYEIVNTDDVVQLVVKSQSHTHNLTLTPAKPATCTEDGNAAYYTCDGCDKWFLDAAGTQEITDKTSVVIAKKGHDYDETAWGYRAAEGHAHKCKNCDAHDTVQPHTPGAATTESTPQTCTVCGYIIAPATGAEPGNVTPEVKPGENAPETNISTSAEDLREMLLTDEEKQQVQNGTDVKIILDIKDAGSTVSNSDKAAIQQVLNGFTVGQYLNIDLYKLIGGDRTDMHETAGKIRIVINVPDSLKNTSSKKTRTFAVIRVHNGNAELLTDLDNSADTITIETDRFSTYAIVYKDTANGGSGDGGDQGGGDDNGNGGGNSGGDDNGSGGGNSGGGDNGSGSGNNGGDSGNGNGSNGGSADQNGGNNSNGGDNGNGGANHNGGNNGTGSNDSAGVGGSKNISQNNSERISAGQSSARDDEPKTGDATPVELYATLAMIAGFAYLLLYFADRERGMTQERKKELVSRLIRWAKQGGRIRKYLALAAIFVLLVYYHSIGKKTCVRWKAVYGE